MRADRTARALDGLEQGLFERLASAILREAEPKYAALTHTGVNADGKTIADPLDGICFVESADPPHLVAFHHTTTSRNKLRSKWLSTNPGEEGDLIKTATVVAERRRMQASLKATLVLTSSKGPSSVLVGDVQELAQAHGLEIDVWDPSRLVHFLNHNPTAQRQLHLRADDN